MRKRASISILLSLVLLSAFLPRLSEATSLGRRVELENGLVLLVAERPTLPMVTLQLLVKAGSLQESKEKAGLAHLTAVLLTLGTTSRSALEISEAIEFMGGSLSSGASRDTASVSLTVLKRDLEKGLELFSDVLLHPAFRDAEIERKVREIKGGIRQKLEDPGTVAREAFLAQIFGDHPYGRPVEGTEQSLDRISRQDLVEFHQRYYLSNNSILAAAGDITLEELKAVVEKHLQGWRRKEVPSLAPSSLAPLSKRRVVKIDRGVTQAHILWGHVGIERQNPDFYPMVVMNHILGGGGLTSRLMRSIREEKGWAYDVHSHFTPGLLPGAFLVNLQTKNETAGAAVQEVLHQIQAIREQGVTEEELQDAKAYITGSFPLRFDTNQEVVSLLAQVELHNLGMDYVEMYPRMMNAVTREDVRRVARERLDLDRYILLVLANQGKVQLPF